MFALLAVFALSVFEDVPLTNDYVEDVRQYALEAARVLFPDAPFGGQYPEITAAAVESEARDGVEIRLLIILLRGVEFNLTILRSGRGTNSVLAITPIEVAGAPANDYKWEDPALVSATVIAELATAISTPPNRFTGEISKVLVYRTQGTGQQESYHVIFADERSGLHSVVYHTRGQGITVQSFRSLQ
jgi:hypothetical protein